MLDDSEDNRHCINFVRDIYRKYNFAEQILALNGMKGTNPRTLMRSHVPEDKMTN